jgi:hypothetical protein
VEYVLPCRRLCIWFRTAASRLLNSFVLMWNASLPERGFVKQINLQRRYGLLRTQATLARDLQLRQGTGAGQAQVIEQPL